MKSDQIQFGGRIISLSSSAVELFICLDWWCHAAVIKLIYLFLCVERNEIDM